jgi:hypothetical protein
MHVIIHTCINTYMYTYVIHTLEYTYLMPHMYVCMYEYTYLMPPQDQNHEERHAYRNDAEY